MTVHAPDRIAEMRPPVASSACRRPQPPAAQSETIFAKVGMEARQGIEECALPTHSGCRETSRAGRCAIDAVGMRPAPYASAKSSRPPPRSRPDDPSNPVRLPNFSRMISPWPRSDANSVFVFAGRPPPPLWGGLPAGATLDRTAPRGKRSGIRTAPPVIGPGTPLPGPKNARQ